MSKTIICSTGTSSAKLLLKELQEQNSGEFISLKSWISQQDSIDIAAEKIAQTFVCFSFNDEANLTAKLSAEIHSLVRIGLDATDRVVLIASGTDDGYCCALAVQKYLLKYWQGVQVEVKQIEGLQVTDVKLFRTKGVVEFVKDVLEIINKYGKDSVILNPTGGFKALVPYTVLIGMLKEVTCRYIFEQSSSLIELPPFPVEFSQFHFEKYQPLFEEIDKESYISVSAWEQKVPHHDRRFMHALFEFEDNTTVTLSAIGFMFVEEIQKPTAYIPYLSQKAFDDCFHNLKKLDNCDPFRYISRMAASSETLEKNKHIAVDEHLVWLKPGNTTDRYLISLEGKHLLVWRGIREDEVGTNYSREVIVRPSIDRAKFSPFMRMDFKE